jgi:hypothetical protein
MSGHPLVQNGSIKARKDQRRQFRRKFDREKSAFRWFNGGSLSLNFSHCYETSRTVETSSHLRYPGILIQIRIQYFATR